jgi:hypothetical protein
MAAPHRLSRTEARRIAIRAQLLEVDRALFEHNATIRPMADLGLFFAGGLDGWTTYDRPRDWVRENDSFRRDILERLRESGPLTSRDIPDTCTVPWASTGWTHKIRNERRLRALGIARAKMPAMPVEPIDVGGAGEPAVVAGTAAEWRVDPAALGGGFEGRRALLSPFDRLIHDRGPRAGHLRLRVHPRDVQAGGEAPLWRGGSGWRPSRRRRA